MDTIKLLNARIRDQDFTIRVLRHLLLSRCDEVDWMREKRKELEARISELEAQKGKSDDAD